MTYQVISEGGMWTSKPTENFELAKKWAEKYRRDNTIHCVVMQFESVWSTETLEEILREERG